MNSFIVFSSILIATFAIQCSDGSAVQVMDSFFPLSSQSINSRGTSHRSRSTRSNSGLRNSDKKIRKMETINFVEQQANQLNSSSYHMNVGDVQQQTNPQDGSIKQGNDVLSYYSINNNDGNSQRKRRPSRYRYRSRSSQLPRSNSLNFPETAKL